MHSSTHSIGFTRQLRCYEKAHGNLFKAESIFNKDPYSEDDSSSALMCEVIPDYSENMRDSKKNCFSNPEIKFCPNSETTIDIAGIEPFSFPLYCNKCNRLISKRYEYLLHFSIIHRLLTTGWNYDEDINLLDEICSILNSSATNDDSQCFTKGQDDDPLFALYAPTNI